MTADIVLMFPAPPALFALFIGLVGVYIIYSLIKVVVSLWTGA